MRRLATTLAIAAALTASGCGSDKTATYKTEYAKAADQFKRSVEEASQKIPNAPTLKDRIPALESFKASIDKLAAELGTLHPPANVGRLNGQAVSGLHRLSSDLDRLRQAAQQGDKRAVAQVAPQLQSDQANLQDTLDKIDQALR